MMGFTSPNHQRFQEGTFQMRASRSLDTVAVIFDDDNLVANAGLILPATLAQHLDLSGADQLEGSPSRLLGGVPARPQGVDAGPFDDRGW